MLLLLSVPNREHQHVPHWRLSHRLEEVSTEIYACPCDGQCFLWYSLFKLIVMCVSLDIIIIILCHDKHGCSWLTLTRSPESQIRCVLALMATPSSYLSLYLSSCFFAIGFSWLILYLLRCSFSGAKRWSMLQSVFQMHMRMDNEFQCFLKWQPEVSPPHVVPSLE